MPRIPVRTKPYTNLARCTRHYKAKRDLILRQLGKANFINGGEFVIAFISPKGEVDAYASELLQPSLNTRDPKTTPCCLNKPELQALADTIKLQMARKWAEIERLEKLGQAPIMLEDTKEEAEAIEAEEVELVHSRSTSPYDNDTTLVGDEIDYKHLINEDALAIEKVVTIPCNSVASTRVSTPTQDMLKSLWEVSTILGEADQYYERRLEDIQQNACKLICKNWIKIIEPKKQINYPYNGGEATKPGWWPQAIRHREPDHLSKQGTSS